MHWFDLITIILIFDIGYWMKKKYISVHIHTENLFKMR